MNRGAWWAIVHGVEKSGIGLSDEAQHSMSLYNLSIIFFFFFKAQLFFKYVWMAIIKKFLYPLLKDCYFSHYQQKDPGVVTFSAQLPQGYDEENACMLHFLLVHALWHEAG